MSLSPDVVSHVAGTPYESGWIAIHRMLREGASWSGRERHCAFLGTGDGRFADVSSVSGLDLLEDGRAAVVTDWDADGAQDLWVMSRTGPRLRLLRNRFAAGAESLSIKLEDASGNGDAVGARVELELEDGRVLVRSVRVGSGYLAQSSLWLHFGLTGASPMLRLRVRWPDGETQTIEDVAFGRWTLARGGELVADRRTAKPLAAGTLESAEFSSKARIPLGVRLPMPQLRATVSGGVPVELLSSYPKRPLLIVPWASWCAPCLTELRELAEQREKLQAAGVTVVALGADEEREGQRASMRFLREIAWPFEVAEADRDLIDVLDLVQQHVLERRRRLPLPSSFLIDARGRLAVITKGALSVDQVVLDVLALQDDAVKVRDSAVPFRGRWRGEPLEPDTLGLEVRLRHAGFDEIAQAYYRAWFVESVQADVGVARTHLQFGLVYMQQRKLDDAAKHLRIAAELDGTLIEAWANLAAVLHRQGNRPRAIEAYETALALDRTHIPARFNMGLALAESGEIERAREQAELLAEFAPELVDRLNGEIDKLK